MSEKKKAVKKAVKKAAIKDIDEVKEVASLVLGNKVIGLYPVPLTQAQGLIIINEIISDRRLMIMPSDVLAAVPLAFSRDDYEIFIDRAIGVDYSVKQ